MNDRGNRKDDYRDSHIAKGGRYDDVLSGDTFDRYMTRWEVAHVLELIKDYFPEGIDRYLDFACGTGRVTQVIAPLATDVVGVDVSDSMLETAKCKVPGARFLSLDLTSTSVDIGEFDLVTSFRFFGNAGVDLRSAALRALNARVKLGALLLVNNHRNPWALMNLLAQVGGEKLDLDLTHGNFSLILRTAGFEVVAVRPIAVWQFRHSLAAHAGQHPKREAFLERIFGRRFLAGIAPDCVILARKIESLV